MQQLESQRGQTMPFWTIGVLITLAMLFFLANYANAITWQIRAQNAADSAAAGTLSVQANVYNEYNVLLYAAAVDEYRLRALNQALVNTLYGQGGCSISNGTCQSDYNELRNEYDTALAGYTDDIHLLDQANNITQGGITTDQQKALSRLQGNTWCSSSSDFACQFAITPVGTNNSSGTLAGGSGVYNEIDIIACKNIPMWGAALFKLNAGTYKLIGRGAAAILPVKTESFNPGALNPQTGQPYQPVEYWSDDQADSAYAVDFSGLNVDLNWYQAGAIRPFSTNTGSYTCS
jgi:hypothetical protein